MLELESTPLLEYIPVIVKEYKPSCEKYKIELSQDVVKNIMNQWLDSTCVTLNSNLTKSLEHVTSVKVLHNIREEATKIGKFCNITASSTVTRPLSILDLAFTDCIRYSFHFFNIKIFYFSFLQSYQKIGIKFV